MIGHYEMTLDDYLAILRRRLWVLLIPALLGPALAYGVSLFLPEKYTSTTLVLVEQQKVPESFVRPVVNDQLNQRLATMQEQILSRSRLQPIIEKFGLFKDDPRPMEDRVSRLRGAVLVTPIKPIVRPQINDMPGFYVSFTNSDPRVAQQVCTEITSMFMQENLLIRQQAAQGTTDFLDKQLQEAKAKLDERDQKLAAFKQKHIGRLPGTEQMNMNLLMTSSSQLEATTQILSRAQQDKAYMESMLAQQLAAWNATKSGQNPLTLEQQLANQESALVALESRYTSDHPDVMKARADVAALRKRIDEAEKTQTVKQDDSSKNSLAEPPQIQQWRTQIHQAEVLIKEKTREQERLQEQIRGLQARLQLSPLVEQEYKDLTRDYETASESYNDLLRKKTQSEIATDLEVRQQGEQFRVIDPPNLPARPSFPNRLLFAGGGLGGGLALGLGIILLLEFRDRALRTARDVEVLLELPTLALIPVVEGVESKKRGFLGFGRKPKPHAAGVTA